VVLGPEGFPPSRDEEPEPQWVVGHKTEALIRGALFEVATPLSAAVPSGESDRGRQVLYGNLLLANPDQPEA